MAHSPGTGSMTARRAGLQHPFPPSGCLFRTSSGKGLFRLSLKFSFRARALLPLDIRAEAIHLVN